MSFKESFLLFLFIGMVIIPFIIVTFIRKFTFKDAMKVWVPMVLGYVLIVIMLYTTYK